MENFIKLSNVVLNKLHIIRITIEPNKYIIYLSQVLYYGTFFSSSGSIYNQELKVEIDNIKNIKDFEIIKKFIETIK